MREEPLCVPGKAEWGLPLSLPQNRGYLCPVNKWKPTVDVHLKDYKAHNVNRRFPRIVIEVTTRGGAVGSYFRHFF